jgi:hypothetical protein
MRPHFRPILALLIITPFLTELLSNNIPPSSFFNPAILLFLATIGYGFPILLLRELACAKRLGVSGMLCLGLLYGIINEGILARTFFLDTGVPITTFDHYGRWWGISVPWAVTISVWHAFHSLLYPILITYSLFPAHRDQQWLGRKSTTILLVFTIVLGTLIFFSRRADRPPPDLPHFIFLILCMGSLAWLSTVVPRSLGQVTRASYGTAIACGAGAFLSLLFVPVLLAAEKIPPLLFCGYLALACGLIAKWLGKRRPHPLSTSLLFAGGDEILFLAVAFLEAIRKGSVQLMVADALMLAAFVVFVVRLRQEFREPESG